MKRSSQIVARFIASLALALALGGGSSQIFQASAEVPLTRAAAGPTHDPRPADRMHRSDPRSETDQQLGIKMRVNPGSLRVALRGEPSTVYHVRLSHNGTLRTGHALSIIRTNGDGRAVRGFPLVLGKRSIGSVTVHTWTLRRDVRRFQSASLFVRPTSSGRLVQAPSVLAAQFAVARANHRTKVDRQRALFRLSAASGHEAGPTAGGPSQSVDSDELAIGGRVLWTDWNGSIFPDSHTHPSRHIEVSLMGFVSGFGYEEFDRVTTDDSGFYQFGETNWQTKSVEVVFHAETSAAAVLSEGVGIYSKSISLGAPLGGESLTQNITIGNEGVDAEAFSIADGLWTAHMYAELAGRRRTPSASVLPQPKATRILPQVTTRWCSVPTNGLLGRHVVLPRVRSLVRLLPRLRHGTCGGRETLFRQQLGVGRLRWRWVWESPRIRDGMRLKASPTTSP